VTRRVVVVPLDAPSWSPPGADLARWRRALAEDVVDLLATLAEVEPALAVAEADRAFAASVAWPGMRLYVLPDLSTHSIMAAAEADGFDQVAIITADAPDLPGMLIAKLLRPLTTRPVAAAPATGEDTGLIGLASRLPAPAWLPQIDFSTATVAEIRAAAPAATDVIGTSGWHRLRHPAALARLDPALEGWDATRAMLSATR
jgi:glycosyltransferase A (GT-A) superfamily protein (DUF2064 family)